MQASPADRLAFAGQLTEVRALDTKGKYKKRLDKLEAAYQFILLHSLDRFHKEMLRAQLPGKLQLIKEKLCNSPPQAYATNLPFSSVNWNIKICRHCHTDTLRLRQFSSELCCELCGLLEPWMASPLTTTKSINTVTTRLPIKDGPTDATTSSTTLTSI